ncbi:hypothetical protein GCM10010168_23850 [Actinoplanes ianthinogenes]|uniref:Uncharacterized protein n=1 Tax=Actinoplanes ianthinogenes TaxID=122358 RepID=A0ABN6CS23_9ACTN|nr:hypothetical protein [Actinoplanes ianthinogenes]BCJ48026.1 hypothetical protein Aiant_86830 [Actinoplanes ianthinogenes]GGR05849.1 hypothetical protein GCM10010168_23850 [Actinoplanes ianthinogenes]
MTSSEHVAGASTDQHISGPQEQGTFTTDEPPTATTPADGSSNAGINRLRANRPGPLAEQGDDQVGDRGDEEDGPADEIV